MREIEVYHVVTNCPMKPGQHIIFNETHHNGVWERVNDKLDIVEEIYKNPDQYDAGRLEHHTSVALRELALEEVRQQKYGEYPSRMGCLYVSGTLKEAQKWAKLFAEWGRTVYQIVRLKVNGNCFYGDARNCFEACLDREENLLLAEHYWENRPNKENEPPIVEILADGDIEVVEIVEVYE